MTFSFKQFVVEHDGNQALKVTTEAIIMGAYLAKKFETMVHGLDIGTGTGLLTLMLAQRSSGTIHAVEINEKAYQLAAQNFSNCCFAEKIKLSKTDIQDYESTIHYDLIFSNPPFFKNNLKGQIPVQNLAKHNDTLSFETLAVQIKRLLANAGRAVVMYPDYEMQLFTKEMHQLGLNLQHQFIIRHRQHAKILRIIATFGFDFVPTETHELIIKDENEVYTADFKELTKDFYTIF